MRAARAPKPLEESVKKTSIPLVLAGFLLLAACSKSEQPVAESPASTGAATPVSSSSPQPATPASPERIAELEASGKTGLWATVDDVCARDIRSGVRTMLRWNVKGRADRVTLYVVDAKHGETHFGQGGPVGERETGPWLRPGLTFRIRNHDTKEDLGSVVIAARAPENCAG